MNQRIDVAAVEDDQILVAGLRAWASATDITLAAVASTVDELLGARGEGFDAVLLDLALLADPDPARNVRRLTAAGHRVLVVDWSARRVHAGRVLAAGAHGYFTRHQGPASLATRGPPHSRR